MNLKKVFLDFFIFNTKNKKGIIVLILFMLTLFILRIFLNTNPNLFSNKNGRLSKKDSIFFKETSSSSNSKYFINKKKHSNSPLNSFDPNTINYQEMIDLGISVKTAKTILNYRAKGGLFKTKEDLLKIYGFSRNLYKKLEPYIKIPNKTSTTYHYNTNKSTSKSPIYITDINSTDSLSLIKIKGIGGYTAKKIIQYRFYLGGYSNINQLYEIKGLDSSQIKTFIEYLQIDNSNIKHININNADYKELCKHPYISNKAAYNIIKIRKLSGNFDKLERLIERNIFTEEEFKRISPYLSI